MMPIGRVKAADRKRAAIHEAGHLTAARALGFKIAWAYIEPTESPLNDEKYWIGKTNVQLGAFKPMQPRAATKLQRRMIACAGAVAEYIYEARSEPEPDFWYDPEIMSLSDWAMADCAPGLPDKHCINGIFRVAGLLAYGGPEWPNVIAAARQLIIRARPERAT